MTKGVNHQIIEISHTDDPYFERALLFVKSTYAQESVDVLAKEGQRFIAQAEAYSGLKQTRAMTWFVRCVCLLGGAIGGVLLGYWLSLGAF